MPGLRQIANYRLGRIFRSSTRVRASWGLNEWRGNGRNSGSNKSDPAGARAERGCCSGSDRAPNFQRSADRQQNPVRGLAQLASLWLHCLSSLERSAYLFQPPLRMGADYRELQALGLRGNRSPLPRKERPVCGARNRRGKPCAVKVSRQAEVPFPRWAVDRTEDRRRPRPHRRGAMAAVECLARRSSNNK